MSSSCTSFSKTWSLLRIPSFYVKVFTFIVPSSFRHFVVERKAVQSELKKIVSEYAPQIRTELKRWEDGFNLWEEENAGPARMGSKYATSMEEAGRRMAVSLSAEMVKKINAIPNIEWHFHPITEPSDLVENPYPGYLTSQRAQRYCDLLIQTFG